MSAAIGSDIATLVFYKNVSQNYSFHLENTSSFLITSSTTYVNKLIAAFRALLVSSASQLSLQIIIALIFVNWIVTLSSILFFLFVIHGSDQQISFSQKVRCIDLCKRCNAIFTKFSFY